MVIDLSTKPSWKDILGYLVFPITAPFEALRDILGILPRKMLIFPATEEFSFYAIKRKNTFIGTELLEQIRKNESPWQSKQKTSFVDFFNKTYQDEIHKNELITHEALITICIYYQLYIKAYDYEEDMWDALITNGEIYNTAQKKYKADISEMFLDLLAVCEHFKIKNYAGLANYLAGKDVSESAQVQVDQKEVDYIIEKGVTLKGLTIQPKTAADDKRPRIQILYLMGNVDCYQKGHEEEIIADIERCKTEFNIIGHVVNPRGVANSTGTPWVVKNLILDYKKIVIYHIEEETKYLLQQNYETERRTNSVLYQQARRKASEAFEIRGQSLGAGYGTILAASLHDEGYRVRLVNGRSFSTAGRAVAGNSKILGFLFNLGTRMIGWHIDALSAYNKKIPEGYKSYFVVKNQNRDDYISPHDINNKIKKRESRIKEIAKELKHLSSVLYILKPIEKKSTSKPKIVASILKREFIQDKKISPRLKIEIGNIIDGLLANKIACSDLVKKFKELKEKLQEESAKEKSTIETLKKKLIDAKVKENKKTKESKEADGVISYAGSMHTGLKLIRQQEKAVINSVIDSLLKIKDFANTPGELDKSISIIGEQLSTAYGIIKMHASDIHTWYKNDVGEEIDLLNTKVNGIDALVNKLNKLKSYRFEANRMHYEEFRTEGKDGHNAPLAELKSQNDRTKNAEDYVDARLKNQYLFLNKQRETDIEKQAPRELGPYHKINKW